jgi:cytoskeletal protein CcmA (bactofilin family)
VVSLTTMMIIGLALLTYLTLAKNQNQLVVRSQVWNSCLPLAEAGLDDALNHCAYNSTNWVSNGWALGATNSCYRSNAMTVGWYMVHIATNAASSNQVTITATGYYPMPGSPTYVPRTVQVKAFQMPSYKFGMMSKHAIDFNGNGCRIDSFDSRDPAKSTGGLYDAAKAGDKADMATYVGSPKATYDVGNGNIWGHVYMGAGGVVRVGSNGKIGSVAWQATAPKSTVQPGWFRTDLNVIIPDANVPFSGGVPPLPGIVDGKLYSAVFSDGYYQVSTLSGEVIVTGKAMLYVTGNLECDLMRIKTNASVQMYCGGSFKFKDTDNQTQRAANFQIFGLPGCTTFTLDNEFMGAVYAPEAAVVINGAKQIYGSVVADSIRLTGGADVHFDEALREPTGNKGGFIITSWIEL